MDEATRQRYLEAMGITVWQSRHSQAVVPDAVVAEVREDNSLDAALERAIDSPPPVIAPVDSEPKLPSAPIPGRVENDVSALGWTELEDRVKNCTACGLCEDRQQTVFGVGVQTARLMVIGEGPGAEEDRQGVPFVGQAGKLLDAMLAAIRFSRAPQAGQQGAYIANVVKCRPPKNRDPKPEEAEACRAYLHRQIALVKPDLILAVGRIAAKNLLDSDETLGRLRQREHRLEIPALGAIPLLVTYHPAYLLRSPQDKRMAWEDLKRARDFLAGGV